MKVKHVAAIGAYELGDGLYATLCGLVVEERVTDPTPLIEAPSWTPTSTACDDCVQAVRELAGES